MSFDPSTMLCIAKLEALLQDIEDLVAIVERQDEPTMSHEDFVTELKRDGLIDPGASV
jgi:hypothetical protein